MNSISLAIVHDKFIAILSFGIVKIINNDWLKKLTTKIFFMYFSRRIFTNIFALYMKNKGNFKKPITTHGVIGPWCNCYRRRKWTRRHEFKSWTRLIAFHIALIPLGKVWIQLFSLQLWVNSRADWVLQPWWGN